MARPQVTGTQSHLSAWHGSWSFYDERWGLLIFLCDVGDIVPGGHHELVPYNLGCSVVKLQEGLCHSLIVELVCREGDGRQLS